jgi:hypothetical protein
MTQPSQRFAKRFVIIGVIFLALITVGVAERSRLIPLLWIFGVGESTYYGWHTNILHAGDSVVLLQEFAPLGHVVLAKGTRATVRSDPAWDEDSCDPDRPVLITVSAADTVSVPRHALRR